MSAPRWVWVAQGVFFGAFVAAIVISRAPGRPVFWALGLLALAGGTAIGAALARGWRPKRARPPFGVPSVWDDDRRSDRW